MIARFVRKLGGLFSRLGFGRVRFFVGVYRKLLIKVLPKTEKELIANGSRMRVRFNRGGVFGDIGAALLLDRGYEMQTTKLFQDLVKPNMRVVDVGANIGYYTLLAAKLVGSKGKVWAFEPEDENFADLKANVALNGYRNVGLFKKAVSDKNGTFVLFLSKDSGGHSLVRYKYVDREMVVEAVRLDSVVKGKVDVLKTDTEGNEIAVLRGAERIIKENKDIKLVVEFQLGLLGSSYVEDLLKIIADYGFGYLYKLDDKLQKTYRISLGEIRNHKGNLQYAPNILCSRKMLKV